MKYRYKKILMLLAINYLYAQDNIINQIGDNGKFIIRDKDFNESLVVEDGNVTIHGYLNLERMPKGDYTDEIVVWDKQSKSLKVISRVFNQKNLLSNSFQEKAWHNLGYNEIDESGNIINANTMRTNSVNWNQFTTDHGYIWLGPANWWAAHIWTDRSLYIFNKEIRVKSGRIGSYSGNLFLRTQGKERITILNTSGNVGIGTKSPSTKLEVAGQIKITGGSPGFGKVLTSDGSGLASWQTPSGGSGASSLWLEFGNDVYRSSGNVGIGTSNPSEKLEVSGNALIGNKNSSSFIQVGNNYCSGNSGTLNPGLFLFKSGTLSYGLKLQYTNGEYGTMMFGPNSSSKFLSFGKVGNALQDDNMIEYMRLDLDNGKLGIGTKTPVTELDVNGSVCATRYGTKNVYTITNWTWDLSMGNIAEVNYSSGIAPITINSDGCVGTFVLIVKKSNNCSNCSLNFQGVNIMWAYGVPPTLSSGSNTTDIISLIAVGNNTFYGYTANNFF